MVEWNIQARAHVCHACGGAFVDRQSYHTLLLDIRGGYQRLDVCDRCWAAEYAAGAVQRPGFVSHWQGVYEVPEARPEPIQKETAETLLRKLIERNEPADVAVTFILAVMLERKRVLKVKDQVRRDDGRLFVYEHGRTGDVFTIRDPALRLDELEVVQRDVARLLELGAAAFAPAEEAASTVPAANGDGTDAKEAGAAEAGEAGKLESGG
jgi:hypothetical protein